MSKNGVLMQMCAETVNSLICFCHLTVVQTSLAPQDLNLVIQLLLVAHHRKSVFTGLSRSLLRCIHLGSAQHQALFNSAAVHRNPEACRKQSFIISCMRSFWITQNLPITRIMAVQYWCFVLVFRTRYLWNKHQCVTQYTKEPSRSPGSCVPGI